MKKTGAQSPVNLPKVQQMVQLRSELSSDSKSHVATFAQVIWLLWTVVFPSVHRGMEGIITIWAKLYSLQAQTTTVPREEPGSQHNPWGPSKPVLECQWGWTSTRGCVWKFTSDSMDNEWKDVPWAAFWESQVSSFSSDCSLSCPRGWPDCLC